MTKIPDVHRSPTRIPHKQLRAIRDRLGKTQKAAAALLNVSYPYYLAIETGQRELSRSLAEKVRETFGVVGIEDKTGEPKIALGKGERAPFTKERYEAWLAKRPSFHIEEGDMVVTPTLDDYARVAHAVLAAAEDEQKLKLVAKEFIKWCQRSISSDAMLEAFRKRFKELFPSELLSSGAFYAAIEHFGRQLEQEGLDALERRGARNERQRKRNRRG